MHYGKGKASKKQKKITSKKAMGKKRVGVRLFRACLIVILLIVIAIGTFGFLFIKRTIDNTPEITADSIKPQGFTSVIYADDGVTETERLVTSGSNREFKSIDNIPEHLQHAFVAIEDSRFYTHNGIDPQGILRAAVVGVKNGFHFTEGASTITQQLIKNNVFPDFVNEETMADKVERKIQEQYLALLIEKELSKEEILESYMNTINLGQNCLGVQSASQRYFGKDVSKLTLSEAVTIAGITKNPGGYNPITNPEKNQERRTKVLKDMLAQGYITQEEHDKALKDDVYARIQKVNNKVQKESNITSYFNDALIEQLMNDLTSDDGLGYSDNQAYNAIYSGGLSIFSTQNLQIQDICDDELKDDSNFPSNVEWGLDYALSVTHEDGSQEHYSAGHVKKFGREECGDKRPLIFSSKKAAEKRIELFKEHLIDEGLAKKSDTFTEYINLSPQPQASVSIIEQSTGQIKALVGGRGEKTTNRGLNRAYTGSVRQPGSCFKILAVYAPALDNGSSLANVEKDEAYSYTGSDKVLVNAYRGYRGDMTLREAIKISCNIVAVKTIQKVKPSTGIEYCRNFGISTLTDDDNNESLALGGISKGVYNYELGAAFAAIANGGVYTEPTLYTKVLDHDGNVLIEKNPKERTVVKETTAALLTSAMEDVVKGGTATAARISNMPVAGKSGTTNDRKDVWFSGFSPYYTCTIWMGYDDPQEQDYSTHHYQTWAEIMERIHDELSLQYKSFTMPSSLTRAKVCTESGLKATKYCEETMSEWFASGTGVSNKCEECEEKAKEEEEEKKKEEEKKRKEEERKKREEEAQRQEEEENNTPVTPETPDPVVPEEPETPEEPEEPETPEEPEE